MDIAEVVSGESGAGYAADVCGTDQYRRNDITFTNSNRFILKVIDGLDASPPSLLLELNLVCFSLPPTESCSHEAPDDPTGIPPPSN